LPATRVDNRQFRAAGLGEPLCQQVRWRLLVFGVDRVPSVIESPNATITPVAGGAASTRASGNRRRIGHDREQVGSGEIPAA
jgi:hypothetical protein